MQQSSVIFFYLFVAFVVYITQRGELPTYLGLLLASPPKAVPQNAPTTTADSSSGVTASDVFKVGAEALPYIAML